ncbi:hypothetical protein HK101_011946 [Irineochytrium annulatum]|nr:hypothetical protein HK101_011946 [Irineochytrium annulatum]
MTFQFGRAGSASQPGAAFTFSQPAWAAEADEPDPPPPGTGPPLEAPMIANWMKEREQRIEAEERERLGRYQAEHGELLEDGNNREKEEDENFISFDLDGLDDDFDDDVPRGRRNRGRRARDQDRLSGAISTVVSEDILMELPVPLWVDDPEKYSTNPVDMFATEVDDYIDYIAPTEAEHTMRLLTIERLKKVVKSVWNEADLFVFGSFETKLYLPTSDIDTVVIHKLLRVPQCLDDLANALRKHRIGTKVEVIAKARVPIIKYVDALTNFPVDVCFNMESGLVTAEVVTLLLQDRTIGRALKALVYLLKQFLSQRSMNEPFSGGLGSEILPEENIGILFIEFLETYGLRFNYDEVGIRLDGNVNVSYFRKSPAPPQEYSSYRQRPKSSLSLYDPTDKGNDVGGGAFKYQMVKYEFARAYHRLTATIAIAHDRLQAYRDRTSPKRGGNRSRHQRYDSDEEQMRDAVSVPVRLNTILGTILSVRRDLFQRRQDVEDLAARVKEGEVETGLEEGVWERVEKEMEEPTAPVTGKRGRDSEEDGELEDERSKYVDARSKRMRRDGDGGRRSRGLDDRRRERDRDYDVDQYKRAGRRGRDEEDDYLRGGKRRKMTGDGYRDSRDRDEYPYRDGDDYRRDGRDRRMREVGEEMERDRRGAEFQREQQERQRKEKKEREKARKREEKQRKKEEVTAAETSNGVRDAVAYDSQNGRFFTLDRAPVPAYGTEEEPVDVRNIIDGGAYSRRTVIGDPSNGIRGSSTTDSPIVIPDSPPIVISDSGSDDGGGSRRKGKRPNAEPRQKRRVLVNAEAKREREPVPVRTDAWEYQNAQARAYAEVGSDSYRSSDRDRDADRPPTLTSQLSGLYENPVPARTSSYLSLYDPPPDDDRKFFSHTDSAPVGLDGNGSDHGVGSRSRAAADRTYPIQEGSERVVSSAASANGGSGGVKEWTSSRVVRWENRNEGVLQQKLLSSRPQIGVLVAKETEEETMMEVMGVSDEAWSYLKNS